MVWYVVSFCVVIMLAVWLWWEFVQKRSILGRTDLSEGLHEMMMCSENGACLTFRPLRSESAVRLKKHVIDNDCFEIEVELTNPVLSREKVSKFRNTLEALGVQISREAASIRSSTVAFHFNGQLPPATYGRIVDSALEAIGLHVGNVYTYQYKGVVNPSRQHDYHKVAH